MRRRGTCYQPSSALGCRPSSCIVEILRDRALVGLA